MPSHRARHLMVQKELLWATQLSGTETKNRLVEFVEKHVEEVAKMLKRETPKS